MNKRVSVCTQTYWFVLSEFDASTVAEEIRFVEVPVGRIDTDEVSVEGPIGRTDKVGRATEPVKASIEVC